MKEQKKNWKEKFEKYIREDHHKDWPTRIEYFGVMFLKEEDKFAKLSYLKSLIADIVKEDRLEVFQEMIKYMEEKARYGDPDTGYNDCIEAAKEYLKTL